MEPDKFPKVNNYNYKYSPEQLVDIRIIMSLQTQEQMSDWIQAVGAEDAIYGVALIESVALDMLDIETAKMKSFPEAESVINRIRAQGV
jgi:hypothetical protein